VGGYGADIITTGDGNDKILGDHGVGKFDDQRILIYFESFDFDLSGNDLISSGAGSDVVFGGNGDDEINGGDGDDTLIGDHAFYDSSSLSLRFVTILEELSGGSDTIFGGNGSDLIYGVHSNDWIEGGIGDDMILTGSGLNVALGGMGDDTIFGGPQSDFIDGGFGSDTLYIDLVDTWVGGLPEDIIVGGRGAYYSILKSVDSSKRNQIKNQDGGSESGDEILGENDVEVNIIVIQIPGFSSLSTLGNFSKAKAESKTKMILNKPSGEISAPKKLGIGDFIEQTWSELIL